MWVTDAKGVNYDSTAQKRKTANKTFLSDKVTKVLIKIAVKMNTNVIYKCMDM